MEEWFSMQRTMIHGIRAQLNANGDLLPLSRPNSLRVMLESVELPPQLSPIAFMNNGQNILGNWSTITLHSFTSSVPDNRRHGMVLDSLSGYLGDVDTASYGPVSLSSFELLNALTDLDASLSRLENSNADIVNDLRKWPVCSDLAKVLVSPTEWRYDSLSEWNHPENYASSPSLDSNDMEGPDATSTPLKIYQPQEMEFTAVNHLYKCGDGKLVYVNPHYQLQNIRDGTSYGRVQLNPWPSSSTNADRNDQAWSSKQTISFSAMPPLKLTNLAQVPTLISDLNNDTVVTQPTNLESGTPSDPSSHSFTSQATNRVGREWRFLESLTFPTNVVPEIQVDTSSVPSVPAPAMSQLNQESVKLMAVETTTPKWTKRWIPKFLRQLWKHFKH